tara:strand:+ start:7792 stop:8514 length:723 start_codon:yes stop_codon:yes gene_type:complete
MSMAAIAITSIAAPLVAGGVSKAISNRKAKNMEGEIQAAQGQIDKLLSERQDVVDKSGDIRAMKDMVSNPYANLGVATQAAEMQAAQTDQALANTLDAMKASGTSAGGATALAQAAAQAKQGISASIETQEAQNNKMRAEGQKQMQTQLMNIESSAISEEIAAFGRQDARDQAAIDRAYGESDFLRSRQMQIQDAGDAAMMAGISGATSAASSFAGTQFGGAGTNSTPKDPNAYDPHRGY